VKKYRDTGYIMILVLPVASLDEGEGRGVVAGAIAPGCSAADSGHKQPHQKNF